MSNQPRAGTIAWTDLTVDAAASIRDFYAEVAGWRSEEVDMGGYCDYNMIGPDGEPVAGVCHARGSNSDLPPVWLNYIVVSDLDRSVERCQELGGEVIVAPKGMGSHGRYGVIRDPAGATVALFQPKQP